MKQLGQIMYETHQGKTGSSCRVSELLTRADETKARVDELKDRIRSLRQSKPCPACGAVCGREDQFCRSCGGKL